VSHGPVVAGAYSPDSSGNLASVALGWQFRFAAGERVSGWGRAIGCDLSYAVEPLVAYLRGDAKTGHTDTVEAQIVPFLRLVPHPLASAALVPYVELGIGLAYTDLRGFDLGSRVQFSDNAGLGLSYSTGGNHRIGVGYRFRHMSHAGLWATSNAGLNSHFLVVTFQ